MGAHWNFHGTIWPATATGITKLGGAGIILVINPLGEFFKDYQCLKGISLFTYVPKLFAGDTIGWSLGLILLVPIVLIIMGIVGFKRVI